MIHWDVNQSLIFQAEANIEDQVIESIQFYQVFLAIFIKFELSNFFLDF